MKSHARTLAKPVVVSTKPSDPFRIVLSDGAVEGLKWLALSLMLVDHVNKLVNHNLWALAALPVIFLAQLVKIRIPRLKWLFYAIYPAHLAVLFVLQSQHWPK